MLWRCPGCSTCISHHDPNTIYRCPICHVELVFNEFTGGLMVRPLAETDDDDNPHRPKLHEELIPGCGERVIMNRFSNCECAAERIDEARLKLERKDIYDE